MARKNTQPTPASPAQAQPDRRRIFDLWPNPQQAEVFDELNADELEALSQSLKKHGLQHPVHITPDNIVLSGQQRICAALRLGWKEIDVIVRYDLAAQGEAAVSEFFVEENLNRRQLDPIGMARAYRELQRIERLQREQGQTADDGVREDMRDRLAKRLGRTGRQLDRLVRLLSLPRAIQTAVSQRRLPVSAAEKLFLVTEEAREAAASAVEKGEDPRAVVDRVVPIRIKQPRLPRYEHPDTAAVRQELSELLSVFSTGHFDAYVEQVEKMRGDNQAALTMLNNVRNIAQRMGQRIDRYVEAARV